MEQRWQSGGFWNQRPSRRPVLQTVRRLNFEGSATQFDFFCGPTVDRSLSTEKTVSDLDLQVFHAEFAVLNGHFTD